ncbi:MAG TPA: hypothetical protein VMI52_08590, partial [Acetobacteraceae bacterium]|nr:hypothetical protein [Acetobacteraceae bacterium]
FLFQVGQGGGSNLITDFNANDRLQVFGESTNSVLQTAQTVTGANGATGVMVTLSDNTQITVLGATGLNTGNFA